MTWFETVERYAPRLSVTFQCLAEEEARASQHPSAAAQDSAPCPAYRLPVERDQFLVVLFLACQEGRRVELGRGE